MNYFTTENIVTLAILLAGIVGTWFVMQDDIKDNALAIKGLKQDADRVHAILLDMVRDCK